MALVVYLVAIFIIICGVYWRWMSSYWYKLGIPYLSEGSVFEDITVKISQTYKAIKHRNLKYGGIFILGKPTFIPADLELLKNIMQRDFEHFIDRQFYINEKAEPLSVHLLSMQGREWKNMRAKITPLFSPAKLQMMFETLAETTFSFSDILNHHSETNEPILIKDFFGRFTTDAIASCAFGIKCDSLKNPHSEFRQVGEKFMEGLKRRMAYSFLIPHDVLRFFNISLMPKFIEKFFINAVENVVQYREKNNVYRKDLLHLLIQLKNRGEVTNDGKIFNDRQETGNFLNINQVSAQCFVFFMGGFDTSCNTLTMALLELALNQNIQNKLRKEIRDHLKSSNGKMTYETVLEMKYLDQIVNETLRKHSPVRFMLRKCTKDYIIPNSDAILRKGTTLILPFHEIHLDPEHYPNPELFDPERFNAENRVKIPENAFLPFGEGPRKCIAYKLGYLQVKTGIIGVIKNFKVTMNSRTKQPIEYDTTPASSVKGELWLNVERID